MRGAAVEKVENLRERGGRVRRRALVAALALVSLLPLWAASVVWISLNDDSYITLTFARSLGQGRGFVYNHPPATLGSTTPLLVFIGALIFRVLPFVELSQAVTYFTAFCLIGAAWSFYFFRRPLRLADWEAALLGVMSLLPAFYFFLGMEAFVFRFLLVIALAAVCAERWLWAGIGAGFLFLTRGEGILMLPCVFAVLAAVEISRCGLVWKPMLMKALAVCGGAACVIIPWVIYAWVTFGRLTPNTLEAKQAHVHYFAGGMDERFGKVWWVWANNAWATPWTDSLNMPSVKWVIWGLAAVGFVEMCRRRPRWLILPLFCALHVAGYSLLEVAFFQWYLLTERFVWLMGLGLGIVAILRGIYRIPARWRWGSHLLAAGVCAFTMAPPALYAVRWMPDFAGDTRAPAYRLVCDWLRENTAPGDTVSFAEIGYLGYFTDNRIIDLGGLVTPDFIPYLAKGDAVTPFWKHRPAYHVWIKGDPSWSAIVENSRFIREYERVAEITPPPPARPPMDVYGVAGPPPRGVMYIYKRRDAGGGE